MEAVAESSHGVSDQTWSELHRLAVEAMKRAYAPYSGYPVGAACLTRDGHYYAGCNVENAAYGVDLCAECGMISDMVKAGSTGILAFAAVNGEEKPVVPCGRCRQLLTEHSTADTLLAMPTGILPLSEVMPFGFGPAELREVPTATILES